MGRGIIVSNHGIPESTIADALSATKSYFSLPLEQKMEVRWLPCDSLHLQRNALLLAREQEDSELQGI